MRKWKTMKVPVEAYDQIRALADQSGENVGDIVAAMLSTSAADFREGVNGLAKMAKQSGAQVPEALTFILGDEVPKNKVSKVAPVGVKAAQVARGDTRVGTRVDRDDDDKSITAEDNPGEDNEGGMSGGEKALLFGVAVVAGLAFVRWQAAQRAAAP